MAKMKKQLAAMRNGLGESPVLRAKVGLTDALLLQTRNQEFSIYLCILFFFNIEEFHDFFLSKKLLYFFVLTNVFCFGAGISTLMSIF